MEISFEGKNALVTGASQGIGRDIAKQLAACGAKVVAVSRSKALLESLKNEVPSIEIIAVDLSDWNATKEALKDIGPIDLLVNNAGIAILEPLTEVTEDQIDKLFAVNVKAVINVTQIIANDLIKRKAPGSIVNVSSKASMGGLLDLTVYCASKGAVDAFTRAAALELGPHNIRVNSVNPTVIMTAMGRAAWSDAERANLVRAKIPLGRFGEVYEVVDAVVYLLSDKASMITGTSLPVDGGYLAA